MKPRQFTSLSGQEMAVVVRDKNRYLINHVESNPDILLILSMIKYDFEYLFGSYSLFVIDNISPPSLHPLLMFVIVKSSAGRFSCFDRNQSTADVIMNKYWLCSCEKKEIS